MNRKWKFIDRDGLSASVLRELTSLFTSLVWLVVILGGFYIVFVTGDKIFHGAIGFSTRMSFALTAGLVAGVWVLIKYLDDPDRRPLRKGGWLPVALILTFSLVYSIFRLVILEGSELEVWWSYISVLLQSLAY